MFVGLVGNTGRLEEIALLCRARGLGLVLDASHMAGTRWRGRHVGAEADASVFSFQAVKNLPTADSGMICFADSELDTEVRRWTWLGIGKDTYTRTVSSDAYKWHYDVDRLGFKYHGNSIMAAMGLVAIRYVDDDNAYRRKLSAWYDELLEDTVPRVPVRDGCESARHLYQILVARRDEVMLGLNERGIYPGVHYRDNAAYPMYTTARGPCPRAGEASARIVSLPLHLRLTRADVVRVSAALREILTEPRPETGPLRLDRLDQADVRGAP